MILWGERDDIMAKAWGVGEGGEGGRRGAVVMAAAADCRGWGGDLGGGGGRPKRT